MFENQNVVEKIFEKIQGQNKGFISWKDFLAAFRNIRAKDAADKIDLFFEMVDTDGNGLLSYDEILEICFETLHIVSDNRDDDFIKNLASSFTDCIFKVRIVSLMVGCWV